MRTGGLHPARRATSACGAQPGFFNCLWKTTGLLCSPDRAGRVEGSGGQRLRKMGHPGESSVQIRWEGRGRQKEAER